MPTRIDILGANPPELLLPPVPWPLRDLLSESALSPTEPPVALASPHASGWLRAARAAKEGTMNVLVLGASVAAGCGADEPPAQIRCMWTPGNSTELSRKCNQTGGWIRHFVDGLHSNLHAAGWRGKSGSTTVYSRNAVSVRFFSRCTAGFLAEAGDAHLILLDVVQLETGLDLELQSTMRALRRHSTHERAYVLLCWRSFFGPRHHLLRDDLDGASTTAALSNGADVLQIYLVVRDLMLRWSTLTGTKSHTYTHPGCSQPHKQNPLLYAQRGKDVVHPAPEGHLLIGRATAQFVAKRLLEAAPHDHSSGRPLVSNLSSSSKADAPEQEPLWERCFNSADQMIPLIQHEDGAAASEGRLPSGWRLVDAGVAKGVRKLGLTSSRVGNRLNLTVSLGPSPNSSGGRCSMLNSIYRHARLVNASEARANPSQRRYLRYAIDLGYRLSRNEAFGSIRLYCAPSTCTCVAIPSLLTKQLNPFPAIETNARLNSNWHYRDEKFDATITATTIFHAYVPEGGQSCTLSITHEPACFALSPKVRHDCLAQRNASGASADSVVTIDSVSAVCASEDMLT